MSRKPEALPDKRRTRIKAAIDLYNSGRRSDAAKELLKCLRLFDEEERNTREYAAFCCNLGAALAESGELGAAIRFFRAALAIYDKRRETLDSALVHFNLGNVYKYREQLASISTSLRNGSGHIPQGGRSLERSSLRYSIRPFFRATRCRRGSEKASVSNMVFAP